MQIKNIFTGIFVLLISLMLVLFLINRDRGSDGQDTAVSSGDKKVEEKVQEDLVNSEGTKKVPSGTTLTSEVINGQTNGFGTIKYSNGIIYDGELQNGKPNGQGTVTFNGGAKQQGEFRGGLANGKGTKIMPDGTKFTGTWTEGKRHGEFVETTPQGEQRLGYWQHDKYVGNEKPAALILCEAECAEMFTKGELKEGMNVESCAWVLCGY